MKKSSFVAMLMGTMSGVLFALGMCMALIPEWEAFQPGVLFGLAGLLLGLITWIIWRKMEHKQLIQISGKTILRIIVGVISAGRRNVFLYGMGQNDDRCRNRINWNCCPSFIDPADKRDQMMKLSVVQAMQKMRHPF